jgi:hypothetical protein
MAGERLLPCSRPALLQLISSIYSYFSYTVGIVPCTDPTPAVLRYLEGRAIL